MPVIYGVPGDALAKGDLLITDGSSQPRKYVEWGAGPDITNAMILDSDSLTVSGFAGAQTTRTGAYDPDAAGNSVIRATLISQTIGVCGTGNQPHVGSYRALARVYAEDAVVAATHGVRLAWQVGDGPFLANSYATVPGGSRFYKLDLGVITVPVVVAGAQRWTGRIEAFTYGSGALEVDFLMLIPIDDGYGKAVAPAPTSSTSLSILDTFDQIAGALTGKVTTLGAATWTSVGGDTDDWAMDTTNHIATRSAVSDAGGGGALNLGRAISAGTTSYAAFTAAVDINFSATPHAANIINTGIAFRITDFSNYGRITVTYPSAIGYPFLRHLRRVGGGTTSNTTGNVLGGAFTAATWYTLTVSVDAAGRVRVWWNARGGTLGSPVWDFTDALYATGGTLASGKVGLYDDNEGATAHSRSVDTFVVSTPPAADVVIYSGRSLRITHDDARRESSDGTAWGDPPSYRGSRSLIPPYGDRQRATRVVAFAHRNNLDTEPWEPLGDTLQVQQAHTPRVTTVPR